MRTPIRVGAFALALVVVFAASAALGNIAGPTRVGPAAHGDSSHAGASPAGSAAGGDGGSPGAHLPAGLQVTDEGYRLAPLSAALALGEAQPFRFRIIGPDGAPVTRYTTSHDKDLHLIVVRRDLAYFQHVHPTLDSDGTWSVPLAVGAPGQYRVFADFSPAGSDKTLTLGVDVPAAGDYRPLPLPAPGRTTTVAGYTVTVDGTLIPGTSSKVTLTVHRDASPVTDLQPYLGAYGHLVALRAGDLAYLHVHPDGAPGDGRTAPGPQVTFHAEVPTAGEYRLYLDFQHAGQVRTAEFTAVAGQPAPAAPEPSPAATPRTSASAPTSGHDDAGHSHG